jgi:peptide/nickel transport system substrate-binding protein
VWVTNESVGTVTPIDPGRDSAGSPIPVGAGPNGLATGGGAVWVTNSLAGTVSQINPKTLLVERTLPAGADPQGVAVVGGTVWVAARRSGRIVRLDAATGEPLSPLTVGANPQDVATVGDAAAITTTTSPEEHRGGTLTILGAAPPTPDYRLVPTTDPQSGESFRPQLVDKLTMTNDGLVGFKRVAGPDGETVVADLAEALPTPTDGGLTYTFQLRRGIKYSTGRPVRASDIRYGLERSYSVNAAYLLKHPPPPTSDLFGAIVGTPECVASPRSCHLNRGIVVDDHTGTITFHLRHPDPDFLAKLATPAAVAVPGNIPRTDSGLHPVPATGPYMITHYERRRAVLERNPNFHEWSHDAQPDGYPDRIVWRFSNTTRRAIAEIEHGTADWLYFAVVFTHQQIHEMETTDAAQTHPSAYPGTTLLDIAPDSPLGRDRRARQAIAYAIDRDKLADMVGGGIALLEVRSTCQMIPPNFPGYRPYCPFRYEPARAHDLARGSASHGKPVSVFSYDGVGVGGYLVGLLKSLGFPARLVPSNAEGDPIHDPDVLELSYAADYVAAEDFIVQVQQGLITPGELRTAREQQSKSQFEGTRAWTAIDRRVTDSARLILIGGSTTLGFMSKRVGNFLFAPVPGNTPIVDQLWVR